MSFIGMYVVVAVLALFAGGLMKTFWPALMRATSWLRAGVLKALTRGLGLQLGPADAQSHAVAEGEHEERPIRLQLGAGRLRVEVSSKEDLTLVPSDLAVYYLRKYSAGSLGESEKIELYASTVLLSSASWSYLTRRRLDTRLQALAELTQQLEDHLSSPSRLLEDLRSPRTPASVRAAIFGFMSRVFSDTDAMAEAAGLISGDPDPSVRLEALRRLSPPPRDLLAGIVAQADRLPKGDAIFLLEEWSWRWDELALAGCRKLLEHPNEDVRAVTLDVLARTAEGHPLILELLEAPMRRQELLTVALELGRELPASLVESWGEPTLSILCDPDLSSSLRRSSWFFLLRMSHRPQAIERAWELVRDRDEPMRVWFIAAIARLLRGDAAERFFEIARRDPGTRVPILLIYDELEGLGEDWLIECSKSKSTMVLEHTIEHMRDFGGPRSIPALEDIRRRYPSRRLVRSAEEAIDTIRARIDPSLYAVGGLSVAEPEGRGQLALTAPAGAVSPTEPDSEAERSP